MNEHKKRQTLVVVDDNQVNLKILVEILRDDYEVVFAMNGREALAMAEANNPDLILLDIQMPEMNGYQVIGLLKQMPAMEGVPVIFLTAMTQQEDEATGLELGAADYITKPINPEIVKLRVRNHLKLKELRDQLRNQRDVLVLKNMELEEHIQRIKRLEGLISICMYCKKIRNEQETWEQLEKYISEHSNARFSHGVCPDCFNKYSENNS